MSKNELIELLFHEDAHLGYGERTATKDPRFGNQSCHWSEFGDNYEFMTLNPLVPGSTRKDINCESLHNILIEFDETPIEEQKELLDVGFPFTSATYSGGKSIHFIIHVEEGFENAAEYKRFVAALYSSLQSIGFNPDVSCKNPSRFTRTPGAFRTLKDSARVEQELLALGRRYVKQELVDLLAIDLTDDQVEGRVYTSSAGDYSDIEMPENPQTISALHIYDQQTLFGTRPVPRGARNRTLFQLACNAARRNIPAWELEPYVLNVFVQGSGMPPEEVEQTIRSAYSRVTPHSH